MSVLNSNIIPFLDLGKQPLANRYLSSLNDSEYFYNLNIGIDPDTKLVSLIEIPDSSLVFNQNYPYISSSSETMKNHFKICANHIKTIFKPKSILEIGSNDGIFIKNFDNSIAECVEPCDNFARITDNLKYKTYNAKFNTSLPINKQYDIIYAANSIPHIPNLEEVFHGILKFLKDDGMFILECPSLLSILVNYSYDQWYNEHPHTFSFIALENILKIYGLFIWKCEEINVHGGSYRFYINKLRAGDIFNIKQKEKVFGIDKIETYQNFATQIKINKDLTIEMLNSFKNNNKKVVAYGATAKSATIFNYCGIDTNLINCIMDTTPAKQNKLSPGVHIPILPYNINLYNADVLLLTAWNYSKEIFEKEKEFKGEFMMLPVPSIVRTNNE